MSTRLNSKHLHSANARNTPSHSLSLSLYHSLIPKTPREPTQTFFVMRKKTSQISTLHVIHHGCMPMSVWFGVKFTPGMPDNARYFRLQCLLIIIPDDSQAATARSSVCSTPSCTLSCTRTTCSPRWDRSTSVSCGGRNTWPHCKW